jgi:hypothetical protein
MDSRQAVARARQFLADHYDDIHDVLLEELERTEGGKGDWKVTLSFARQTAVSSRLESILARPLQRHYRLLTVDDTTGEIRSMKIRELHQQV